MFSMRCSTFFQGLFFLGLGLALSSCFSKSLSTPEPISQKEILLGEYGSMSGPESTFGRSTHQGIELAVEEANLKGGVQGKKIRLIHYDTQGKADEAIAAVTKLITQDKVHLILGEVASSLSLAAAPVAQSYQVPMMSPASTHPRVTQLGNYIFRGCFIEPFQGSVMAKFARNHLNLKKAAILRDQESEYSHELAKFFIKDFRQLGGTVLLDLAYHSTGESTSSLLLKIKEAKPDLIFIPGYYQDVQKIGKEVKKLGIRAVLLGGDGWEGLKPNPQDPFALFGAYFSSHFSSDDRSPFVQSFNDKFKIRFGTLPNSLAALGYDAASLALNALGRAKNLTHSEIRTAVQNTKNFEGVTGLISINSQRNAVKPAVVIKVEPSGTFSYVASINP